MSELNLMKTRKRLSATAAAPELADGGLPKKDRLLVKLCGSFENGCRFCISMHSAEARRQDLGQGWIDAITVWPASRARFDERGNLIREFTTAGTRLSDRDFDVELQERVIDELGEKTTGDLIGALPQK